MDLDNVFLCKLIQNLWSDYIKDCVLNNSKSWEIGDDDNRIAMNRDAFVQAILSELQNHKSLNGKKAFFHEEKSTERIFLLVVCGITIIK